MVARIDKVSGSRRRHLDMRSMEGPRWGEVKGFGRHFVRLEVLERERHELNRGKIKMFGGDPEVNMEGDGGAALTSPPPETPIVAYRARSLPPPAPAQRWKAWRESADEN